MAATLEQAYQSHQEESVQFSWTTVAAPQVVIMDGKPEESTARAPASKAARVDKRPMLYKVFVMEGYQENQDTQARRTVQRFCPSKLSKQQAIEVSVSFRLVSGHASAISTRANVLMHGRFVPRSSLA